MSPARRIVLALCLAASIAACGRPAVRGRVIVLGFDGMDYGLASALMAEGLMPNFSRLAASGRFGPLATTIPAQSPVAWSTFITGTDPGRHGIYDFVHRDPGSRQPYLSTSRTTPAGRKLRIGRYQFPLSGGTVELLRKGQPFWETLADRGVRTTIVRMPANFPPSGTADRELSGMGTPDLLGTYGSYSLYTSEPFAFRGRTLPGGRLHRVDVRDNVVEATLHGPGNPYLRSGEAVALPFRVYLDGTNPVVKIAAGPEERILREGEWSDWVPVAFPLLPGQRLHGMCRFYVRQVRPHFEMYVSPVNLDPYEPALPISTPPSFAADLARATGRFYTQGMPEDTKALEDGALEPDEFLAQARLAADEVTRQFDHVLDTYEGGLLFYYVGNLDQVSHMMWRPMDPGHPAYDPVKDPKYRNVVRDLYVRLDGMVGTALERMGGETTLVVMSDHGFASWRRAFHLNSWLRESGYLAIGPGSQDGSGLFDNVNWSRTRAYGLGLNGLYLNLQGREAGGIVAPADRDRLLGEISARLLATIDPATGSPAVVKVHRPDEAYAGTGITGDAPDLIVAYASGTRCSNESALGGVPAAVIVDNTAAWSGDHCWDPEAVPGLLLTSRPLRLPAPSLERLADAILAEFEKE